MFAFFNIQFFVDILALIIIVMEIILIAEAAVNIRAIIEIFFQFYINVSIKPMYCVSWEHYINARLAQEISF